MSSISGINSNSLLNTLISSLTDSANSDSSSSTESEVTDTQQTISDSTTTSITTLIDQMKIISLQNQYSFITSLFNSDDSFSSDSLTSLMENKNTASNTQISQSLTALNSSSSSDSGVSSTTQEIFDQYLSLLSDKSSLIKITS